MDGYLVAFQIRLDVPCQGRKYVWLSIAKLNKGCSPGSPVSLSGNPDTDRVFVTEGILKAEITHQRTGETYIGNPGVANPGLPEKEGKAGADPQGCVKLYEICEELSLSCHRVAWDIDKEGMWQKQYKGIDDWELREMEDSYGNAAA